ncbi:hypothetical protein K439DRAFT_1624211 [Ramaria rubella]|nr:hypothetical protein K439DRAFT_1624211 [Ramaria rubella]
MSIPAFVLTSALTFVLTSALTFIRAFTLAFAPTLALIFVPMFALTCLLTSVLTSALTTAHALLTCMMWVKDSMLTDMEQTAATSHASRSFMHTTSSVMLSPQHTESGVTTAFFLAAYRVIREAVEGQDLPTASGYLSVA